MNDYYPAPDELRDAWINDADAGSCEGENDLEETRDESEQQHNETCTTNENQR